MKFCVVIPCFDHPDTVAAVARAAQMVCPVLVVDDGSCPPVPPDTAPTVIRLETNSGKGAALRIGFQRAHELGYTHAITMDADGQHFAEDLPKLLDAATARPGALIVGVRDFFAAGCPTHRRRSNAVSTFWFRAETGVRLRDTQCGFRCYPLTLTNVLKTRSGRYAFELEFMVRAAWLETPVVPVPVKSTYSPDQIRRSHFRPVMDLAHITFINIGLVAQSWFVPQKLRVLWSLGKKESLWQTIADIFSDHAHEPARVASAVGLGLFFGISPFWGVQMLLAATLAHWLRLNKAIALLACNISIPPVAPFIIYGATVLGHWLFTGKVLAISPAQFRAHAGEFLWQWFIGSFVLATAVAAIGIFTTYFAARWWRRK
jgi:uncharacterized protein (DUF2062 family)